MFHKGLNKEIIIDAATELIEEDGFSGFSMRKLADKLGIKTASLYTHIESMEALFTEVGLCALKNQRDFLLAAIGENQGDSAVIALSESYPRFALEHRELYKLIMQMPSGKNEVLKEAAAMTVEPFMRVLDEYNIGEERKMHMQRVLRAIMHGFVSEALLGYFSHYPVSADESYRIAVDCAIDGLHRQEREYLGK